MAKIELKGIIKEVSPVTHVGTNNTKKQTLILFVPGYTDEFGDKKGRDEEWQIDVIGDKVGTLNLSDASHVNQKAKCTVWIGSQPFTKDDKKMYFISANLGAIECLGKTQINQQAVALPSGNADDLPF